MTFDECIKEIVTTEFQEGVCFDSHTVISIIFSNPDYFNLYLQEYHNLYSNCDINQYHGFIAQKIERTGFAKLLHDSYSLNIFGVVSKNTLWQRI